MGIYRIGGRIELIKQLSWILDKLCAGKCRKYQQENLQLEYRVGELTSTKISLEQKLMETKKNLNLYKSYNDKCHKSLDKYKVKVAELQTQLDLGHSYKNEHEKYWVNYYPKANIIYQAQGKYKRDVRTLLADKSAILEKIVNDNHLNIGTDDEKINKIQTWVKYNIRYVSDLTTHKVSEYWQHAEETAQSKQGDCEDGAILIKSLALVAGIPDYKVKVLAGWVQDPRNPKRQVGHAYCSYLVEGDTLEQDKWVIIDWTYYPNLKPVNQKAVLHEDPRYNPVDNPIWFSFTKAYTYAQHDTTAPKRVKDKKQ